MRMTTPTAPSPTFTAADGRVLGLHDSRFDERQRRLQLRLKDRPTCWDFAPLLDVTQHEAGFDIPRFTGKSAAEWMAELGQSDRAELERFRSWYEALVGHRRGLGRHAHIPARHYAVELPSPPVVSTLSRLIAEASTKRATVAQWIGTLRGFGARGLKQEELAESGVLTRLQLRTPGSILTRQQLLRLVDLDHVTPRLVRECQREVAVEAGWAEVCERLTERELRREGLPRPAMPFDRFLIRHRHRSLGWVIIQARHTDLFAADRNWWCLLDERRRYLRGQPCDGFTSPEAAIAFADGRIKQAFPTWRKDQADLSWDHFTLPGGHDYREILVQVDAWPGSYTPRHFRTRNVLVHLRTEVRHVVDGRRVLFLDEIQSDWHADLHDDADPDRRDEFPPPRAPFRNEWALLALKVMLWWAQRLKVDGLAWSSAALQGARWRGFDPPLLLYLEILPDAARRLGKVLGLAVEEAQFRIRTYSRHVTEGRTGWEVRNDVDRPVTKPFPTRAQAEAFADLTGEFLLVPAPVLWFNALPRIESVPLYGVGTLESWFVPVLHTRMRTLGAAGEPPAR